MIEMSHFLCHHIKRMYINYLKIIYFAKCSYFTQHSGIAFPCYHAFFTLFRGIHSFRSIFAATNQVFMDSTRQMKMNELLKREISGVFQLKGRALFGPELISI